MNTRLPPLEPYEPYGPSWVQDANLPYADAMCNSSTTVFFEDRKMGPGERMLVTGMRIRILQSQCDPLEIIHAISFARFDIIEPNMEALIIFPGSDMVDFLRKTLVDHNFSVPLAINEWVHYRVRIHFGSYFDSFRGSMIRVTLLGRHFLKK